MKIITGATGSNHVTSADDGSLYASIFGSGEIVFPIGDQLESEILSANRIKIKSGDIMMYGRFGRIPHNSYDEVTIESGTAGYNRNDIIVCEYRNDGNIESMVLKAVKGEPTIGVATDPTLETGNILQGATLNQMPLYRVKLNGINVPTIEKLFTVCSLLDIIGFVNGKLPVNKGGTGASDASSARTNLGLGNVNNTSDANKPISNAVQTALNGKANNHSHPYLSTNGGTVNGDVDLRDLAANGIKISGYNSMGHATNPTRLVAISPNAPYWLTYATPEDIVKSGGGVVRYQNGVTGDGVARMTAYTPADYSCTIRYYPHMGLARVYAFIPSRNNDYSADTVIDLIKITAATNGKPSVVPSGTTPLSVYCGSTTPVSAYIVQDGSEGHIKIKGHGAKIGNAQPIFISGWYSIA